MSLRCGRGATRLFLVALCSISTVALLSAALSWLSVAAPGWHGTFAVHTGECSYRAKVGGYGQGWWCRRYLQFHSALGTGRGLWL